MSQQYDVLNTTTKVKQLRLREWKTTPNPNSVVIYATTKLTLQCKYASQIFVWISVHLICLMSLTSHACANTSL